MNNPLSAFAETLRESDEAFYNTFPAAKLALLGYCPTPHTLYSDSCSFVYDTQQNPTAGTYVQVNHPLIEYQSVDHQLAQLHYDYPVYSQPEYHPSLYSPGGQGHIYGETLHRTSPVSSENAYNGLQQLSTTIQYTQQPEYAPESLSQASSPTEHFVSSPSYLYGSPDTPPELTKYATEDARVTPLIQSPATTPPSNGHIGPVRSHSLATLYPSDTSARQVRPSRPRHHESNNPYPPHHPQTQAYNQPHTHERPLIQPSRHGRSMSQGGHAVLRVPIRAMSASGPWTDAHGAMGGIGKGGHPGANVVVDSSGMGSMRLSPLPSNNRASLEKKPPLACLFCRGRKIACGAPLPGSLDRTCNQCQRRQLTCEYPSESRRGMRKKKTDVDDPSAPAKEASIPVPTGKTLV